MNGIGPRGRPKARQRQHRRGPSAFNRRRHTDELIPARLDLWQRDVRLDNRCEHSRHGQPTRDMQVTVPQMTQARTEIEAQQLADREGVVELWI